MYALNRGEISPQALARVDMAQLRLSAEIQLNWLPLVLGPMMLRPGTQFIGEIYQDKPCAILPFIAAADDTAVIELTDRLMRVWVDDALVTRAAVATSVPPFTAGNWTLVATGTATATLTGALAFGNANSGASATATAAVAVAPADQATEHALRVVVANGPILLRIGSATGLDDIFGVETLDTGTYSMAFTPGAATIYIQFGTTATDSTSATLSDLPTTTVTSIAIEAAGVMTLPAPWRAADLAPISKVRFDQSADVVFLACAGYPQYQINRYSPTSWSVVLYKPFKGPMPGFAGDATILLQPGALSGNTTLNANKSAFKPSDVGTLFRLFHNGQTVIESLSFSDTYTDPIRVAGVCYTSTVDGSGNVVNQASTDRDFALTLSGTWVGTVTLQRSFEGPTSGFTDYKSFTGNLSANSVRDGLNNEIIWYRLGFKPGDFTSGVATGELSYTGGGGAGYCRVTGYVSPTQVEIEILVPFLSTTNASDWHQSVWSDANGWPGAVAIHEGRLWWAGADRLWGSASDDYSNFDFDATGDAAPISRSVGSGPIANINWLLSMNRLLAGADTRIVSARSDGFDTPLTPSNFNLKSSTTNGSATLPAVRIDQRGVYVQQSGRRVYDLLFDTGLFDYKPSDLSRLNPEIGLPGYVGIAVQRQPDTRILLPRGDGQMVQILYDADDEVNAFFRYQTMGAFEGSPAVLPGPVEDAVYVVVSRTIAGATKRYLEKFARIDECQGGTLNKQADAHVIYAGAPTLTLPGYGHLVGQQVVVWADGLDRGTATVAGDGTVTLPGAVPVANAVGGLGYSAPFKSAKLAYAAPSGTAINQVKRVDHIGFVLQNTHYQGLQYGVSPEPWIVTSSQAGPGFSSGFSSGFQIGALPIEGASYAPGTGTLQLDDLPLVELGALTADGTIWPQYDMKMMEFAGDHSPDTRIYLQAAAPRPCTVLGFTIALTTSG